MNNARTRFRNNSHKRLRFESLEGRNLLAALAEFTVNVVADNGGVPGEELTGPIDVGDSFFVEIFAREYHPLVGGLTGVALDLNWNPQELANLDPNMADVITSDLPLFRTGTIDAASGEINDLAGGASIPLKQGRPIGNSRPDLFATLHFQALAPAEEALIHLSGGRSGIGSVPVLNLGPKDVDFEDAVLSIVAADEAAETTTPVPNELVPQDQEPVEVVIPADIESPPEENSPAANMSPRERSLEALKQAKDSVLAAIDAAQAAAKNDIERAARLQQRVERLQQRYDALNTRIAAVQDIITTALNTPRNLRSKIQAYANNIRDTIAPVVDTVMENWNKTTNFFLLTILAALCLSSTGWAQLRDGSYIDDAATRRAYLRAQTVGKRPPAMRRQSVAEEAETETAAKPTAEVQPAQYAEEIVVSEGDGAEFVESSEPWAYGDGYDYGMSSCGPGGCQPRVGALPIFALDRLWVRGEYLIWSMHGFATPPLVTTSTAGTDATQAGILGLASTSIVYGNSRLEDQFRSGGRVTVGWWLNPCETDGIQATYFGLESGTTTSSFSSNSIPILARPYFNVEPGFEGQDAELITFPNLFEGGIAVQSRSSLQGVEVLFRRMMAQDGNWRVDGVLGYRYGRLAESLTLMDNRTVVGTGTPLAIGTIFSETDMFQTSNEFNGGDIGFIAQTCYGRLSFEWLLKLAIGGTHSRVNISGQSTSSVPVAGGAPQVTTTDAGLLAQASNIGSYEHDQFTVIPELGATLGYNFTPYLKATVNYTFIYWGGVARPGDQIDTNLNLSQLAVGGLNGIPSPVFRYTSSDVWVQGLALGLDYQF